MKMPWCVLAVLTIAESASQDYANSKYGLQGSVFASLDADDRCAAEDVQCGLSLLQTRVRVGRNADKVSRVLSEGQSGSGESSAINLEMGLEGDSILEASMTPAEAKLLCAQLPGCKGFTFQYRADQDGPAVIHFRSRLDAADPSLTTVTMDSHTGNAAEVDSELAKTSKGESSSFKQPTPYIEDTLAKTDAREEYLFEPVDGGKERACRGLSGTDHSEMYYSSESTSTLAACKDLCVKASGCVGISFNDDSEQCEVWNKPAYIGMSVASAGSQCHRFLGRNPGLDGQAAVPAKATNDPMSDLHDLTDKLKELTVPEKKDDKLGAGLFNKIEKLGAKILDHDGEADGSDETIEMMHQMHEAAKTLEKFEKESDKEAQKKDDKTHHSAHGHSKHKEGGDAPIKSKQHSKIKEQSAKSDHIPTDSGFSELGTSIVEQIAKLGSKIFALEDGMKHSQGAGTMDVTAGEAIFSEHDAYTFVGGDLAVDPEKMTVQQAKAKCSALAGCVGFSYKGAPSDQGPVEIVFKSTWESAGFGWTSFHMQTHKAAKDSIQKALMVIETALNKTEDELVTHDQQADQTAITPASNMVSVSQTGGAMYDFQAVDGGVDRACRGLSSSDSFAWYYDLSSADSLEGCKELCVNAAVCKGIEYNSDIGVCELWTREQGIGTSTSAAGYECHRLVAVERSPSSHKASNKVALIQMGEIARNDTNAVETAWKELKSAHLGFDTVDGGVGRACRGSSELDNSTEYYAVEKAASLDGCKLLCANADGCVGISFHNPTGRCEVWSRPQGISSSTPADDSECHRFLGLGVTLTEQKSYTFAGDDLLIESMTLEQAKTKCAVLPGCEGFTFQEVPQGGVVEVHFKSEWELSGQGWTSFHLEGHAPIEESSFNSDSASQIANASTDESSQIAQMGTNLLDQIAKLGNKMVVPHEDSSGELSMDDVQKMINTAVDLAKKGKDSPENSAKPGKVSSGKLNTQDVQKMIDDAVRQKQHKFHKEQEHRSAQSKDAVESPTQSKDPMESMQRQMDELKAAVAAAKDAVPNRHIKSSSEVAESDVERQNQDEVQPMPKKEQLVWADNMRESAEDLKIVQAPLTKKRRGRKEVIREDLHEGHKQQSQAQQQRDLEVQQQQKRIEEQRLLRDHWLHQEHDREESEVLKTSEDHKHEVRSKLGRAEHDHSQQHEEHKQQDQQKSLHHQNQQLSEQNRTGQREVQKQQLKSQKHGQEKQHAQQSHYEQQQETQKELEQKQFQQEQKLEHERKLLEEQMQQQAHHAHQTHSTHHVHDEEQAQAEQAEPQQVQQEQQEQQAQQMQQTQQEEQVQKTQKAQKTQKTKRAQPQQVQAQQELQEQKVPQAQQAQQVQQVQQMLNEQQQVQQEQDQQEQWAQQDQQEAEHQQLDEQEQLKLEKQRQKQDSWFKKHLLPKPKAIKEMADLQDQKAAPSVTSQQDVEVGAEAVVIADAEASTEASKEAGSESITEASTEVRAEETQKAGKKASDEASKEVSKEVSEDESNESNEESREKSTEKVSSAKEMADQSADKKTSHAKKHGKKHDSTLDVAVRAAKATTEAVASLSDMKDQKDGSLEELQAQTEHLNNALDAAEDATAAMNDQVDLDQLVQPNQQKQPKLLVEQSIDEGLKSPHNELLKAPTDSKHLPLLERVGATSAIKEAFQVEQKQHMHLEQQRQKRDQLLEAQQARVQGQLAQEKIQDKEWGREQDWFSQHLAPKHKGHHDRHPV